MTTETPQNNCLRCGYKFECASGVDDPKVKPEAGSLSVCLKCGAVAKFAADLRVEPLTEQEAAKLASDAETMAYLRRIVGTIHVIQQLHGRRN